MGIEQQEQVLRQIHVLTLGPNTTTGVLAKGECISREFDGMTCGHVRWILKKISLAFLAAAAGCGPSQEQFDGLEKRVAAIEGRYEEEQKVVADEKVVVSLVQRMMQIAQGAEQAEALEIWNQLKTEYSSSPILKDERVAMVGAELEVVGRSTPKLPTPKQWFVGDDSALDISTGAVLVLFWELW